MKSLKVSDIENYLSDGPLPRFINVQKGEAAMAIIATFGFSENDVIQLCGGIPSADISNMKVAFLGKSKHVIRVEIDCDLYFIQQTIDFNLKIISNDLMHAKSEDNNIVTSLFLSQVKQARKMGFTALYAQAQSREYDTGIESIEWEGYFRWARLGYQMYLPEDIKRFNLILKNATPPRPEVTLSGLVLSDKDDQGYEFWKKLQSNFTWSAKFELADGSESMNHLLTFLKKKKISNYKP